MRVRFIGSGDAFGSGGRWQTCIGVTSEGSTLLVDCGATSLVAMRAQGVDPGSVDAVAVTHLHGDHFGGLPFLVLDGQFSRRTTPLRILGPPGIAARLAQAMEAMFPGSTGISRRFEIEVTELEPGGPPIEAGPFGVRGWEVVHASGAPPLALRVSDGRSSFGYSGDTEWTPALRTVADGADLFAVESYTYDRPVRYHLDYATLHEHRDELPAGRIVLTHMSASMLAMAPTVEPAAAHDGLTMTIGE